MDTIKVAVTGVGGGVGQSILKCLYDPHFTLVGFDSHYLATGLFAVPIAYTIPPPSQENYVDTLLALCQKEGCRFLFPGLDTELMLLAQNSERFKAVGTQVVVSSPQVIQIADNKFKTYQFLKEHGIAVPETILLDDYLSGGNTLPFPLVLKPTVGSSRSVNVFVIQDKAALHAIISYKNFDRNAFVLQEHIKGDEFTCGTINFSGECFGAIVFRRTLRDGDTYKCFTEQNKTIEDTARKAMEALKPFGACNVQLRVREEIPYIFEINARCSGTTAARALAGFNEPQMVVDYLLYNKKPTYTTRNISILRYLNELVVANEKVETMNTFHTVSNDNFPKL